MQVESDTQVVQSAGGSAPSKLSTVVFPVERIGRRTFEARTTIVRTLHFHYQQKNHVFGYISPTVGATFSGYGTVYGGGGSISSRNESVVQVVYCDRDGCENTVELPASISVREGSVLRLDHLNGTLYAAQNISGRQEVRALLGPNSFIPWFPWSRNMTILCVLALGCLIAHVWVGALLLAGSPAYTIYRQATIRRDRKALGIYMANALSASPVII